MLNLTKSRLADILSGFPSLHMGVIGDLALDAYWHADMTRALLSRETPHFPRPVVREAYSCGAGANVADNLNALGVGHVSVFSVLGDDWRGALLQHVMAEKGIDGSQLRITTQRCTPAYIKPVLMGFESQQEDARIDFENSAALPEQHENALLDVIKQQMPALDALLIADQLENYGIVTDHVRGGLNAMAALYPHKIFAVDSRLHIGAYNHMVLKPNKLEAINAVDGIDPNTTSYDVLVKTVETLSQRTDRPVFRTLGDQGVLVYADGYAHLLPAGPTHPPLDPVGAGDTFIATLTCALAVGASAWEAGMIANLASAVTVEKLNQTGTASP
ncbi:MAG: sugar kinase, partial [Anaerolineales bacterium]